MKFYTDISHYTDKKDWVNVPHVIRPYFVQDQSPLSASMLSIYTDKISDADYAILPMNLEYYYTKGLKEQMHEFIKMVRKSGKPLIAINDGDYGIKYDLNDIIVLCQNGYQSSRKQNEYAHAFIVDDPLPLFFGLTDIRIRDKGKKPVIGFDGLAGQPLAKTAYHILNNIKHNVLSLSGISIFATNRLIPGTVYREKALRLIEADSRIEANFNKRKKFRAGARNADEQKSLSLEFYSNMMNSDYILCCRGGGNFSKRIYETLAMGRIPVFINTDCILPLDNIIDWKKYCIWVEKDDIKHICDKIVEFHNNLSNEEFRALQISCRKMWEDHLTEYGELISLQSLVNK